MNIYDKANEFARALKETTEVVDYKKAQDKVMSNDTNKKMVEDFRKKQFELYSMQMQGKEPSQKEIEQLNNLWSVISMNNDVKQYIESEMQFSKLWEDIMKILGDAVDIDFSMGLKG